LFLSITTSFNLVITLLSAFLGLVFNFFYAIQIKTDRNINESNICTSNENSTEEQIQYNFNLN